MRLQIVCRGSVKHGLGHLFRASTFAKAAHQAHEVEVVAITEPVLDVIFEPLPVPTRIVREERECPRHVREFEPDVLVFDTTSLSDATFGACVEHAELVASISPVFSQMEHVDLRFTRTTKTPPVDGVTTHGGLEYAIFNEHCRRLETSKYAQNLEEPDFPIAICMGGTDAANKTLKVLRRVTEIERNCTIWVLLGEGYAHPYAELVDSVRGNHFHEVILAKTNRSMWRILSNCVLAILAGGLTTIEAAYAGLPTINLFEKEWQARVMSPELFEKGVALDGGLFTDESLDTMVHQLTALQDEPDQLLQMHRNADGLLDGRASYRILDVIQDRLEQEL